MLGGVDTDDSLSPRSELLENIECFISANYLRSSGAAAQQGWEIGDRRHVRWLPLLHRTRPRTNSGSLTSPGWNKMKNRVQTFPCLRRLGERP